MEVQILTLLMLLSGICAKINIAELQEKYMTHLNEVHNFPCAQPQPRCIKAMDIYLEDRQMLPSESLYPTHTILHICDSTSGCCGDKLNCREADSQMVDLYFQVYDHINETYREEVIWATNHTKCSCAESIPRR